LNAEAAKITQRAQNKTAEKENDKKYRNFSFEKSVFIFGIPSALFA
jgi:peroxiredoxin